MSSKQQGAHEWLVDELAWSEAALERFCSIAPVLDLLEEDRKFVDDYGAAVIRAIEDLTIAIRSCKPTETHADYITAVQAVQRARLSVQVADSMQFDVALRVAILALVRGRS